MIVSTQITGIGLERAFMAAAAATGTDLSVAVYRSGAMLRTRVRANASGRPGPRVITGDYRRSISQHNTHRGTVAEAHVFTNAPQALRLEFGFRGVDALGRRHNQQPYPHWRPATEGMDQFLAEQASDVLRKSMARFGRARLGRELFGG